MVGIARAAAFGTRNIDVGQELHVEADRAGAVAHWATQPSGVVGEVARLVTGGPGIGRAGEDLAQLVVNIGVSSHRGAHVGTDGCRIDELDVFDTRRIDIFHMGWQRRARYRRFERRNEAFENQRGFARPRYARHHREAAFGNDDFERFYGVNLGGGETDRPLYEEFAFRHDGQHAGFDLACQKRADARRRTAFDLPDRPLRNDPSAVGPRSGAHLDDMVGMAQYLRVVVDQHDGVSVGDQVVHNTRETCDVGRMKTDGGFVEHIHHARSTVAHCAGQLHTLPLAGG